MLLGIENFVHILEQFFQISWSKFTNSYGYDSENYHFCHIVDRAQSCLKGTVWKMEITETYALFQQLLLESKGSE